MTIRKCGLDDGEHLIRKYLSGVEDLGGFVWVDSGGLMFVCADHNRRRAVRLPCCTIRLVKAGVMRVSGYGGCDGQPVLVVEGFAQNSVGGGFSARKARDGGEIEW